jgi:prepilin-type N-terminal cleavage/methylation domain-containing protein
MKPSKFADRIMFPQKGRGGFTLVELLVTIAILAILAALLLKGVSQAKARGQRIQCVNNLRQLGIALQGFVTENGSYPLLIDPGHGGAWMALLQHGQLSGKALSAKTHPYAEGVWKCPTASKPSNWPERSGYNSYGYNWYGMSGAQDTNAIGLGGHYVWDGPRLPAPPVRESEVVSPSDMIAIGVCWRGWASKGRNSGLMANFSDKLPWKRGTGETPAPRQSQCRVL